MEQARIRRAISDLANKSPQPEGKTRAGRAGGIKKGPLNPAGTYACKVRIGREINYVNTIAARGYRGSSRTRASTGNMENPFHHPPPSSIGPSICRRARRPDPVSPRSAAAARSRCFFSVGPLMNLRRGRILSELAGFYCGRCV